jgi:hypothetical protein
MCGDAKKFRGVDSQGVNMRKVARHAIDASLLGLFLLSIAAILLAHEDPFIREIICKFGSCPEGARLPEQVNGEACL